MKKTHLSPVYILLSAALAVSSAQQPMRYVLTDKMDFSVPNFPANYFDDNTFSDPQFNQYLLRNYNWFESKKIPTIETAQENMGAYVNNPQTVNGSPYGWQTYKGNGHQEPQMPILNEPLVFPSRGFPISEESFNFPSHGFPISEVPVSEDKISFGPSTSHMATASKSINNEQPHAIYYQNVEPKDMSEGTTHKTKAIENVPVTTTPKVGHGSTKTLPPVPTLSPWFDGF